MQSKRAVKKSGKRKPSVGKGTRGRPSKFSPALAKKIIGGLSVGTPLTILCKPDDMPSDDTVRNWAKTDAAFSRDIARAREAGFDQIAMDAMAIADEVTEKDTIETAHGPIPNKEWLLRSKLRVDVRLKLLSKWDPKRYGDKITQEISGPEGAPIQTESNYRPSPEDEAVIHRIAGIRNQMREDRNAE